MFAALDPWILAFSLVTVVVTIWMGFRSAKTSKSASDFFVAGRSVSVGWNASAISGEYLSAASFMGVAGMVMSSGYDALWYPVCYACGYLFLLLFIAGPLRRFGAYTIPDFAEGRYDSPLFRKIAVIFVLFIGFFYTMPQMKGAGTTLAYIFQDVDLRGGWLEFLAPHSPTGEAMKGFPYWAGVVVVGAVITLNVALGGMKGITLVQAFQYWVKMFAISVPIFVLMSVYGHYGKQLEKTSSRPPANAAETAKFSETGYWREFPDRSPAKIDGDLNPHSAESIIHDYARHGLAFPLRQLLYAYRWQSEKSLLIPRSLNLETNLPVPMIQNAFVTTGSVAFERMDQSLAAVGLRMVPDGSGILRLVMAEDSDRVASWVKLRDSKLPPKAPADSTWLNPFGPLTTKAAKAAKPQVEYHGELTKVAEYSVNPTDLREAANWATTKVRSTNTTTYSSGSISVSAIVGVYAAHVLQNDVRNFGTKAIVMVAPSLLEKEVNWAGTMDRDEREIPQIIVKTMLTNGITVFHEPGNVFKAFPTKDAVITPVDPKPYALLYTYSLIIALVCGTAGLPHILVRFYTNPDGVAAKRTTMWVMILIGIFYVFPPVFGVMGRNLMPSLYEGTGAKGTDKVVLELPKVLDAKDGGIWKTGKQENGKTGADGSVLPSSTPVFPSSNTPAIGASGGIPWGSILSGITCAGAFAAFMSTFSGLLVSMTGALAHDVYGRMLRPNSTPAERMRMFKFCAVAVGTVAVVLGSFVEPLQINFMVGQAFAIAAASYFPLLFMSVWWRGMTMRGAAAGMLTGGVCALAAVTLTNFSDLKWLPLGDFWAAHPLLRILCEQPAIWTVPLAIGLMVAVSKLTRATVPADVRMKMLVLHAPEKLGLKQEYIKEHEAHGH